MSAEKATTKTLQLRVITRKAPAAHLGEATEFGLQNKKKDLAPGQPSGRGRLAFVCEVTAVQTPSGVRFRGEWVHGKTGAQHLYVGWRVCGDAGWINRMKIALPSTEQVAAATGSTVLETDATGPVWGVLKNWHGLNLGQVWR